MIYISVGHFVLLNWHLIKWLPHYVMWWSNLVTLYMIMSISLSINSFVVCWWVHFVPSNCNFCNTFYDHSFIISLEYVICHICFCLCYHVQFLVYHSYIVLYHSAFRYFIMTFNYVTTAFLGMNSPYYSMWYNDLIICLYFLIIVTHVGVWIVHFTPC